MLLIETASAGQKTETADQTWHRRSNTCTTNSTEAGNIQTVVPPNHNHPHYQWKLVFVEREQSSILYCAMSMRAPFASHLTQHFLIATCTMTVQILYLDTVHQFWVLVGLQSLDNALYATIATESQWHQSYTDICVPTAPDQDLHRRELPNLTKRTCA